MLRRLLALFRRRPTLAQKLVALHMASAAGQSALD